MVPSFRVVNKSRSQRAEEWETGSRPHGRVAGRRQRTVLLKVAPLSSFPRRRESIVPIAMGPRSPAFAEDKFRGDDVDIQNRGNKARMFMKTKHKYKKSPSSVAQTAGSAVCGFSVVAGAVTPPEVSEV